MQLELYQAETQRIAQEQMALLQEAQQRLEHGLPLTRLEQSGVLHALQVLIENAIGKSKHWLKLMGQDVPVSAYDAFFSLEREGVITQHELLQWNVVIGLRNRIVHDYMGVDIQFIYNLISNNQHKFVGEFLKSPIQA